MLRFFQTKIGISVLIALVVIGTAAAFRYRKPDSNASITGKVGLLAEESVKNALKNGQIDNPDWESALKDLGFGTSTDEIVKNLEEKASTATSSKPLTATDRFAREFMTEYLQLKKSGAPIDESTGLQLVNSLLSRDYGGPIGEKTYVGSDVRVMNTSSLSELKKYGNTLGTIFKEPLPKGYENELDIVTRVTQSENYTDLKKLALNIARYEKIRSNLAVISVPLPLKSIHLSLLNSLSLIIEGVRGMAILDTDPVGATNMILKYQDGLKLFEDATNALTTYFTKQNLIFSSTEPGFIFVK